MIDIRPAQASDAPSVKILLGHLGYEMSVDSVRSRLAELERGQSDPVLLASDEHETLGLIAIHWSPMLHLEKPIARITALVVCEAARGRGIGRMLVDCGADVARRAGCDALELTTALRRTDAHAFYKALGFRQSSLRFLRPLI